MTTANRVVCYDDASIKPKKKGVGFDTMTGNGSGQFNKTPSTIEWKFVDGGEPNRNDVMTIIVRAGAAIVFDYSGPVGTGKIQAHSK